MPKLNLAHLELEELEELPSREIKVDVIHRIYSNTRAYRGDCRSIIDYNMVNRQIAHHVGKHINTLRTYFCEKYTGYKLAKVIEHMRNQIDLVDELHKIGMRFFKYVLDENQCIQENKEKYDPWKFQFGHDTNPVILDMEGGLYMVQKNGVWFRALPAPRDSFFQSKHVVNLVMGTPHYFKEMHWRRDALGYNTAPKEDGSYKGPFEGFPGMEHKYIKNLELATMQETTQANDKIFELGVKMTDITTLFGYRKTYFF